MIMTTVMAIIRTILGFDVVQTYSHEGWRGRMRASALVTTMPPPAQAAFDADLARALAASYPDPMPVSTTVEPPTTRGIVTAMMVTTGISAFFKACRPTTTRSLSPLARAVVK